MYASAEAEFLFSLNTTAVDGSERRNAKEHSEIDDAGGVIQSNANTFHHITCPGIDFTWRFLDEETCVERDVLAMSSTCERSKTLINSPYSLPSLPDLQTPNLLHLFLKSVSVVRPSIEIQ